MLAMAESLPIHVMSGPDLIARDMKETHPTLRRGDAFLHNSPYHGNSHAADWCVVDPSHRQRGRPPLHSACQGAPGRLRQLGSDHVLADATDVYEEGALIFPCVKVQENYEMREDVLRMARVRIRVPELWYGDFLALLGAARIGERRLLEMLDEVGAETINRYSSAVVRLQRAADDQRDPAPPEGHRRASRERTTQSRGCPKASRSK